MKVCNNNHNEIVYLSANCPLCQLMKHNNKVHDFIESKGKDLVLELVKFMFKENKKGD